MIKPSYNIAALASAGEKRRARDVLSVADCILRLLDSLPDGDLPKPIRDAMGEVTDATFSLVVCAKRLEQGINANGDMPVEVCR